MLGVPETFRGGNYCNVILNGATTEEKLVLLLGGRALRDKGAKETWDDPGMHSGDDQSKEKKHFPAPPVC